MVVPSRDTLTKTKKGMLRSDAPGLRTVLFLIILFFGVSLHRLQWILVVFDVFWVILLTFWALLL